MYAGFFFKNSNISQILAWPELHIFIMISWKNRDHKALVRLFYHLPKLKIQEGACCYNRVKLILTIKNIKIHYLHLRVYQPGWCHASDIEKSYWGNFFQILKNSPHTCVNTEGFPCSSMFSSSSSFTFRPWISSCRWIRPLHL